MPPIRQPVPGRELGERVRKLRNERGWTQEQLAKQAGLSKSAISEVESEVTQPRGPNLIRLATALGASIDYLLTGLERPPPSPPAVIKVPNELAEVARKLGLPYQHVELLLQFNSQIEAMRRDQPARNLTEHDWRDLYDRVGPLLERASGGKK